VPPTHNALWQKDLRPGDFGAIRLGQSLGQFGRTAPGF
jgi:hypothetical protein